jgi:hypothetical protein
VSLKLSLSISSLEDAEDFSDGVETCSNSESMLESTEDIKLNCEIFESNNELLVSELLELEESPRAFLRL